MALGWLPGTEAEAYAVIEAAWRLEDRDLQRVLRRIELLRRTGRAVLGILVDRADPTDRELLGLIAASDIQRVHLPDFDHAA